MAVRPGKKRALVIGGSLGGLLAAHLLRAIGWDAVVFERIDADLASRGVGIGTHDALDEVMRRILPNEAASGVLLSVARCFDPAGCAIAELPISRVMSAWSSYYRPLRRAWPDECYRAGKSLVAVEQSADEAAAVFADGTRECGDLLVAADGIRSTVRAQYLPTIQPLYAGYVAWRAMAAESDLPAELLPSLGCYGFCLPPGELILAYPVPGRGGEITPGKRGFNAVWYRPVACGAGLADLCTDAEGTCHGMAIPPPLIRRAVIADLNRAAERLLPPHIAAVVTRTEQPFFQAIFDLASPRLAMGRVVLMGDAAFVARPHVGAGVTKAAIDAMCLAESIAARSDLDEALARYDRLQRRLGDALVARGRRIGAYIGTEARAPLAVMRDHSGRIKFSRPDTSGRAACALLPETRLDYYYG